MKGNERGITLIALIITIIVLLILAGVSIALVVGDNGVLSQAVNAADETNRANVQSELEMAVSAVVTDWSGDKYINGNTQTLSQYMTKARVEANMNTEEYELAAFTLNTENGVNVVYRGKGYNFTVEITESGNSAKVTYGGEGEPAPSKEWTQEGDTITDGEVSLQVGDYINYDEQTGAVTPTYTSLGTATGVGEGEEYNQIFTLAEYTGGWRVFGVDEEGRLQIISEDLIIPSNTEGSGYYLRGVTGLKNAVTELDNIAALYGQGEYAESARSVTREDLVKFANFDINDWNTTEGYGKDQLYQYGNEVTYYWDGTNYPYYESTMLSTPGNLSNSHSNGFYWYDFETETWNHDEFNNGATTDSKDEIVTLTNDFYAFMGSDYLSGDKYDLIFTDSNSGGNAEYWLGSRYVFTDPGCADFGVYEVGDGYVGSYRLAYSDGAEGGDSAAARPLVSLQSNIQLTSAGEGTWDISGS